MSYTYTDHVANGSQVTFPFRFAGRDKAYISATDVQVGFVEAGTWLPATGWTLSGTNQITFLTPPTEGKQIRIRRIVDKINPYAYFERGNVLDINSLNNSFIKNLQVSQEILDGFFPEGFYFKTDLDMGGHKIINLHEGSESGDAVNYDQFKELSDRVNEIESDFTGLSHRTVPMYYIATGGESRWEIGHWTFDAAILFINGIFQNQNLGAFTISNNGFNFAEPLQKGDEVYALVGSRIAAPDECVTISDLKDPDKAWRLIGRKYPFATDGTFMSKVVHDVDYSNIFIGASGLSQGFCIVDTPQGARMFFHQPIPSTNKVRFVETTFNPEGDNENPSVISFSQELDDIGHQTVCGVYEGGSVRLYTLSADEKSYYIIDWLGNNTSNAHMRKVQIPTEGIYSKDLFVSVGMSEDTKTLVFHATTNTQAFGNKDDARAIYLFDRKTLDSTSTRGLKRRFEVGAPAAPDMAFQGVACDDRFLYIYHGYNGVLLSHKISVFTLSGEHVRDIPVDSVRVKYGERMYGDADLGYPVLQEPEGLAMYKGKLYMLCMDFWYKNASVVTFAGRTFATRKSSAFSGYSPLQSSYWTPTNLIPPTGAPEYNKTATYSCSNATKLSKAIVSLEIDDGTGFPASVGCSLPESSASVYLNNRAMNMAIGPNENFQFGVFHQNLQSYKNLLQLNRENPNTDGSAAVWRLFGGAFTDDIQNERFVQIKHRLNPTQDAMELRADVDLTSGGGINLYSMNDSASPGRVRLYCTDGYSYWSALLSPVSPSFHPDQDKTLNLGTANNRWNLVHCQGIRIISNDESQKQVFLETTRKKGALQISTSGNLGVWDSSAGTYVVATRPDGTGFSQVEMSFRGDVFPETNKTYNLGRENKAWANAYFQNAPTIVSDARLKTPARELTDAEAKAFLEISKLAAVWQWLDKVEEEGEDARIHAGCTVQAAIAVMEKYGLDWTKYSAFCYDKWDAREAVYDIVDGKSVLVEEAVEAGDRYRLRREELLWWCMKAQNVWIDSIEGRLSQLEEKLKEV